MSTAINSPEPQVLYESPELLAVDKPAGIVVHPPKVTGRKFVPEPTLTDWLASRYPELRKVGDDPGNRPGIVHRLDKETSGVLLVPRTQEYFLYLKSLFQSHAIQKTYLALVHGIPAQEKGVIDRPIGIKTGTVKRSVFSDKMAKEALTRYVLRRSFLLSNGEKVSLLEVRPETGRTHQIRIHLKSIGHAIVGDPLYGWKKEPRAVARMMLHASEIEFDNRPGHRLVLGAPLPDGFIGEGPELP